MFKKSLFTILVLFLLVGTCYAGCGDKYDDCFKKCWDIAMWSGHITECGDKCYDEYEDCKNGTVGCFIETIKDNIKTQEEKEEDFLEKRVDK